MHATPSPAPTEPACASFLAALDAALDGEADQLSVARTEAHAAQCPPCAARLREARRYRARLRQLGEREQAPASLRERVQALLRGMRGSATS